jgi:hypothetical protein
MTGAARRLTERGTTVITGQGGLGGTHLNRFHKNGSPEYFKSKLNLELTQILQVKGPP